LDLSEYSESYFARENLRALERLGTEPDLVRALEEALHRGGRIIAHSGYKEENLDAMRSKLEASRQRAEKLRENNSRLKAKKRRLAQENSTLAQKNQELAVENAQLATRYSACATGSRTPQRRSCSGFREQPGSSKSVGPEYRRKCWASRIEISSTIFVHNPMVDFSANFHNGLFLVGGWRLERSRATLSGMARRKTSAGS
jgi:hypothetical protein